MSAQIAVDTPEPVGHWVPMARADGPLHLVMVCDQRGMIGPQTCLDDETMCGVAVASRKGELHRVPLTSIRIDVSDGVGHVISHDTCELCFSEVGWPR